MYLTYTILKKVFMRAIRICVQAATNRDETEITALACKITAVCPS